jgi:ATP-dependent Lon protease
MAGKILQENKKPIHTASGNSGAVPVLALRDTVVYPRLGAPLAVFRSISVKALEAALAGDRRLVLVAQRQEETEHPGTADLYAVGTLVKVREADRQTDGSFRVAADGLVRVRLGEVVLRDGALWTEVQEWPAPETGKSERLESLVYSTVNQFRRIVGMGANVPFDVVLAAINMSDAWFLGDLVAAHLDLKLDEKQAVLEAATAAEKLERLGVALARQIQLLQVASQIQADAGQELDKMQREMFLREQQRSIERELETLGVRPDDELFNKLEAAGLPPAVREKAFKEYGRLKQAPPSSPEASYLRTWLETLVELPWTPGAAPPIDLKKAKRRLDADHFGLDKVKNRILEYLAVRKLTGGYRGPILCFVGPPGTGKTSIGKSIAESVGREFHRISLGGIRDEAEIRGHRKTYVGAMPGRIIQGLKSVKSRTPVFMLDELDKVGSDWRGDPAAALLEALDPEQNHNFSDHYLEVPYDLSEVMFIATANVIENVPPALRDRLEVIRFPGYTEEDKLRIATDHLIPRSLEKCGLAATRVAFQPAAISKIIQSYTMEAGVRNLERHLTAIGRKLARQQAEARANAPQPRKRLIKKNEVAEFLGPEKILPSLKESRDAVGRITGLAWTEYGGDILRIEAAAMPGKGQLQLTGHLGQVMKESAQAALTCIRSSAQRLGFDAPAKETDIHLHVPAGAIPKDGPSAGAAIAATLYSLFTNQRLDRHVGVTGEITLRGDVLEVGGIREKVLAARRAGLRTVVLPASNRKDLVELPKQARADMKFVFAKRLEDVLAAVIVKPRRAQPKRPRK